MLTKFIRVNLGHWQKMLNKENTYWQQWRNNIILQRSVPGPWPSPVRGQSTPFITNKLVITQNDDSNSLDTRQRRDNILTGTLLTINADRLPEASTLTPSTTAAPSSRRNFGQRPGKTPVHVGGSRRPPVAALVVAHGLVSAAALRHVQLMVLLFVVVAAAAAAVHERVAGGKSLALVAGVRHELYEKVFARRGQTLVAQRVAEVS